MRTFESREDYLEKILMLSREQAQVRSVDIARRMQVSKPSVSIALKGLKEQGYVLMDESNLVSLTSKGAELAQKILDRHTQLARFFVSLGVEEETAFHDACRIEHVISQESFQAICRLSEQQFAGRENK